MEVATPFIFAALFVAVPMCVCIIANLCGYKARGRGHQDNV